MYDNGTACSFNKCIKKSCFLWPTLFEYFNFLKKDDYVLTIKLFSSPHVTFSGKERLGALGEQTWTGPLPDARLTMVSTGLPPAGL